MDHAFPVFIVIGSLIYVALAAALFWPGAGRSEVVGRMSSSMRRARSSRLDPPPDGGPSDLATGPARPEPSETSARAITIHLSQTTDACWPWTVAYGPATLATGEAASGDEGFSAAREAMDHLLAAGLEAEICGPARRESRLAPFIAVTRAAI